MIASRIESTIIRLALKQRMRLLAAAFFALKQGGGLVYSTCTFSPEENEGVIDWFLGKFGYQIELRPMPLPLKNVSSGLSGWRGKKFSPQLRLAKRIIPNGVMEGFFIARLAKIRG